MFTSRSAVEAYQDCSRYRYNQYHLGGKGLVRVQKSVPLVTGSTVHRGIEHILQRVRIGEPVNVDIAVQEALREYRDSCEREGFFDKQIKSDRQQAFTFEEQKALCEGLIRAWAIAELPRIQERYEVVAVERDIEPIEISKDIWFQAKVDAEFKERVSGDFFNYSIKTSKGWGEREENSYKSDLQGITEIWTVEQDAIRSNEIIDNIVKQLQKISETPIAGPFKNIEAMMGYWGKKKVDKKVSGTRFCILIKGARKKPDYYGNDPNALMITYSPLIRGYKRITPSEVLYAHSWFVPNSQNKSGKSTIGAGWEPFNVWEDMGVKKWIEMLASGEIQPECGDVIKQQVITPVEYFRSEKELVNGMLEVKFQEQSIKYALDKLQFAIQIDDNDKYESLLATHFPHIRKHCEFHFGGPCEYKDLCWKPEVAENPEGSGLYQIRKPHHIKESLA